MKSVHNADNTSPNQKLAEEYQHLIKTDIDKFLGMLEKGQVQTNCLTPKQQKIIAKRRRRLTKKESILAFKTLWRFMADYKSMIYFLIFITIISAVLNCLAVFGLKSLTELVSFSQMTNPANPNDVSIIWSNFNIFCAYAGVLIAFYFAMSILMWFQTRMMAIIAQKVGYKIRQKLFIKIQRLPVKYFDQNSSGDLMSKFTNDINNITNGLTQNAASLLNGVFMALGMFICMFLMSSYLALITLGLLPLIFIPIMIITKKSQPLYKQTQQSLGKLNGFIEEMISGQSVVSLFNQEKKVEADFEVVNNQLKDATKKAQGMSALIFPYTNFFLNVLTFVITLIGLVFILKEIPFGGITLPDIHGVVMPVDPSTPGAGTEQAAEQMGRFMSGIATIASFSMMARGFLQPFAQVGNVMNMLQMALAGANRSFQVFEEEEEVTPYEHLILQVAIGSHYDPKNQKLNDLLKVWDRSYENTEETEEVKKPKTGDEYANEILNQKKVTPLEPCQRVVTNGAVRAEDLNFSYVKDKQILYDINIDAKEGQTIAIVGPTGSGKSTFINLLTKFYDINDGDIKIGDEISIKDITKPSIRKNVSIVLQDTFLFNESIKTNIRYGKMDATDEEIIEAAKTANAHNFIMQLPNGYDTVLEDNGEGLSQGQRQLLAIARAVLAPSSILILDEATSSIDTKTEIEIQTAMLRLMKNKTSFVIAHRLSTIQNADQILVLKDGHIIERGTHQELLDMNGFYAQLFNSQFYEEQDI